MEGTQPESIEVHFDVPTDWKITSPWDLLPEQTHRFRVADLDELLQSAFMAGNHSEHTIGQGGFRVSIGLGGKSVIAQAGLFSSLVGGYLAAYTDLHGVPPSKNFALLASDATFTGGGVLGHTISMVFEGELNDDTVPMLMYITAHEMFHLWNANHNYAENTYAEMQWFGEGFAEYYTFLTALRVGSIDAGFFLEVRPKSRHLG